MRWKYQKMWEILQLPAVNQTIGDINLATNTHSTSTNFWYDKTWFFHNSWFSFFLSHTQTDPLNWEKCRSPLFGLRLSLTHPSLKSPTKPISTIKTAILPQIKVRTWTGFEKHSPIKLSNWCTMSFLWDKHLQNSTPHNLLITSLAITGLRRFNLHE